MTQQHTPGPWSWREDEFRSKYMQRMRNGNWRAKSGHRANESWVFLLTGAVRNPTIPENHRDEWDYPHVLALRWVNVRGKSVYGAGPKPADASLIAATPDLLEALKDLTALYMASPGCDPHFIAKARAAIAKATSPQAQ
mgnify:FL=1